MAKKFLDEHLGRVNETHNQMPNFATSRKLRHTRPSAQSVKYDPLMGKVTDSQNLVMIPDNVSELVSHEPQGLVSPRGLSNVPSKVSLATERYQTLSITSPANSQARLGIASKLSGNNSPKSKNLDTLRRELKQLNKWLDGREIQIRAALESETVADKILELNGTLESVFQLAMTQLQTKIPGN